MIQQTREFGVYHWDTFDDETFLVNEFDTFNEAVKFVEENEYKGRIRDSGADRVDIVDKNGNIVKKYSIG